MRTRQGYGAAIAAVMAASALNTGKESSPDSLPIAGGRAPNWREGGRQRRAEVPNKTKRGLRRRVTRGRH